MELLVVIATIGVLVALLRFFRWLGKECTAQIAFICSEMWQAYLKVIAKKAPHALHV